MILKINKKLVASIIIGISTLSFANEQAILTELDISPARYKNVIDFSEGILKKFETSSFVVNGVKIINKAKIKDVDNFTGYVIEFEVESEGKKQILTDIFFVENNGIIVTQMFSFDGKNMTKRMRFKIGKDFYTKKRLSLGTSGDAKEKIAVFLDVYCPYCRENFQKLSDATKGREDLGLYLFSFPLKKHPSSEILMAYAKQVKDVTGRDWLPELMTTPLSRKIIRSTNLLEIAKEFKRVTGVMPDSKSIKKYIKEVEKDKEVGRKFGVSSTPSMMINGERKELFDIPPRHKK
jgi:hypothetical protein